MIPELIPNGYLGINMCNMFSIVIVVKLIIKNPWNAHGIDETELI